MPALPRQVRVVEARQYRAIINERRECQNVFGYLVVKGVCSEGVVV